MSTSNVTLARLFALTFLAASSSAALGCAVDAAPSPSPSPSAATVASTEVDAGSEAASHGVARYSARLDGAFTNVALLDAHGAQIATVQSYGITDGRHISYVHGGVDIELESVKGTLSAWVNGHSRGTQSVDTSTVSSVQGASALDLSDVGSDASTLFTVAADPALQATLAALRGGESPDMFGLGRCPGWVAAGGCATALATGAGAAVCAYCLIAFL